MKLKMDAKLLADMVSTAAQAISANPMLPVYECVYVRVTSESGNPIMSVTGKDAGMCIVKFTDKLVAMEDGEALIPEKTLIAFLKLMDGELELSVDPKLKCQIKCGGKKTAIVCMDSEDCVFDFTPITDEQMVAMDGDAFCGIVESTQHCVADNDGRPILTGIHFAFDAESGICEGVALDGFRMAIAKKRVETNESFEVTIPMAAAKLIAKNIKGRESATFRFGNGACIVESGDVAIGAILLSGEFMDYKKLAFRDGRMQARVNVADMLEAVKLARISASTGTKELIALDFAKDSVMRVKANNEQTEAVTDVYCDANGGMDDGTVYEIAFNGKYVEEALKAASDYSGEVTLLMNTHTSPMAILPVDRSDFYQLALPVRRLGKE